MTLECGSLLPLCLKPACWRGREVCSLLWRPQPHTCWPGRFSHQTFGSVSSGRQQAAAVVEWNTQSGSKLPHSKTLVATACRLDHLHPSDLSYAAMANAINLKLFKNGEGH